MDWLGNLIIDAVASKAARVLGPAQWLVAHRVVCLDAARHVHDVFAPEVRGVQVL